MNFSSPYLLCSIALISIVRRSISRCVRTSFCTFLSWSKVCFSKYSSASSCKSLIGWILVALWPNLTLGTEAGSGDSDSLPEA